METIKHTNLLLEEAHTGAAEHCCDFLFAVHNVRLAASRFVVNKSWLW